MTMMTTSFSGIKNREEIRVSKFGGWGRNKGFWSEYLPMDGIDFKKICTSCNFISFDHSFLCNVAQEHLFFRILKKKGKLWITYTVLIEPLIVELTLSTKYIQLMQKH